MQVRIAIRLRGLMAIRLAINYFGKSFPLKSKVKGKYLCIKTSKMFSKNDT